MSGSPTVWDPSGGPLPVPTGYVLRRLCGADANALLRFYNGRSIESKRTFRPIGLDADLAACEAICQANAAAVSPLDTPAGKYDLALWHADAIVGWCFIWELDKPEPQLGLGIADAHQGRGLGKVMMSAMMHWARSARLTAVHLIVVKDNAPAIRLYQWSGFAICGERISPVDGVAYYRMCADLHPA